MRADAREATALLNRRWRPALMAYFMRRVRHREEAEDLTQEVFARMVARTDLGDTGDGYVFAIAANLISDRARRQHVRRNHQTTLADLYPAGCDEFDPHRLTVARMELARVTAALEELPERQRAIFILYRFENMNQDLIGEAFGISVSAVKKQVAKTIAYLIAHKEGGQ